MTQARQLWLLAALSGAMMALGLVWALFETRMFQGALVWVKPVKFALSFVVYFATLALVVGRMSAQTRKMGAVIAVLAAAFWGEMIYMTLQAARGQASHFNLDTPLAAWLYSMMGVGAVALVAGMALIGWWAARDTAADMTAELRFGVGAGFILSCALTLITAATLSSMSGHFVGTPPEGAAVIPFLGWSASVGDLRPSHFAALHAMQAIPLMAMAVQGRANARAWIIAGAVVYSAVTLALYAQALLGLPIWRL